MVEDGDLSTAGSIPSSSLDWPSDLFGRLGLARGLDYSLANRLFHLVKAEGLQLPSVEIHQPALARGEDRFLLKWSVEEAGPALVREGLVTPSELEAILAVMDRDTRNHDILVLTPRMFQVWGRKPN